jgi:hypothetical protein
MHLALGELKLCSSPRSICLTDPKIAFKAAVAHLAIPGSPQSASAHVLDGC